MIHYTSVRITKVERDYLKAAAEEDGIPMSEYLHRLIQADRRQRQLEAAKTETMRDGQ